MGLPLWLNSRESACSAGNSGDAGSIPQSDDGIARAREFSRNPLAHAPNFGKEIRDAEVMEGDCNPHPPSLSPVSTGEKGVADESARRKIDRGMHSVRSGLVLDVDDVGHEFTDGVPEDAKARPVPLLYAGTNDYITRRGERLLAPTCLYRCQHAHLYAERGERSGNFIRAIAYAALP